MEKASSLLNLIKNRRSIRSFRSGEVPNELVDAIIEAGRWAPSAGNRQPWRFIVIKDAKPREKIGQIYQEIIAEGLREIPADSPRFATLKERIEADYYKNIFFVAPVSIVICAAIKESYRMRTHFMDCAVAIQNMLLMAHSLGLGSVYIDFNRPEHEHLLKDLENLLEIPEDIKIMAILPIGYPANIPEAPARKSLHQIRYQGKYGRTVPMA